MLHLLKRHPLSIQAFLRRSLVLTYAFPRRLLDPLLPPGLALDVYGDFGFLAIALVQTEGLRPAYLPAAFGRDFFLSGYRIFTRLGARRGLWILRSDTDSPWLVRTGNLLTRYRYRLCRVDLTETPGRLDCSIHTPQAEADLEVRAEIGDAAAPLPVGSPFSNAKDARRFAGPLPHTFDYEPESHSIVSVRGVRKEWNPRPVKVEVRKNTFLEREPFCRAAPILANSFYVRNVPYRWERGIRTALEGQ